MGIYNSKSWVYEYKLYKSCSTGKLIVPLTACISTANVHDSQKFDDLIKSFAGTIKNILAYHALIIPNYITLVIDMVLD